MDLWLVALASEITDRQKAVFACWRGEESENISLASLNQPGGPMSSRLLWVQKLTVIPWCCSRPLCPHTERQERNHVNHHLVDFQLQSWAWCDRRVSCKWDAVLEWMNRMTGLHCLPTILKRVVMESMHDFRGHTTGEQDKQNYFLSLLFVLLL